MDRLLNSKYYDFKDPGSFGGVSRLAKSANISISKAREWLMKSDTYTLHKPVRKRYPRRKTIAKGINELFQADLVDMRHLSKHNDGVKYILTVIDVFSKYSYALPLKSKRGVDVLEGFKKIFNHRKPKFLQTDAGKEFFNKYITKFLKTQNIFHFATFSDLKAAIVERFNKSLKNRMFRVFTYRQSNRYIDILQDLVDGYNQSVHRSIGVRPIDVNGSLEKKIFKKLYGYNKDINFKFNVNDQVRISKVRRNFQRGYLPGWTEEIFQIHKRYSTHPPTYQLRDLKEEVVEGKFYTEELQKVNKHTNDLWKIEKILKTKGKGSNKEYFVKWSGFDDRFNSWVKESWMTRNFT